MIKKILRLCLLLLVTCFSLANLRAQEPQSLISKIAAATSDSQRNAAYIQLINYYKATNIDSAIFYAQQCLNKAVAGKDVLGQAQMMEVLGKIDQGQGRMEIARQRVAYALDLYNEIGDKAGVAGMYNSLGALEATLGNSDAAVRYLIKALTIYDSIKENFEGIMVTNMNLGCVYLQSGDTTAAVRPAANSARRPARRGRSASPSRVDAMRVGVRVGTRASGGGRREGCMGACGRGGDEEMR